jgi:hypothetical protein
VCARLSEVWDFTNSRGRLRDCCCKRCTESKTQITRGYLKIIARSACRDPFGSLEFASESSEGIEPLKCSKGGRSKSSHRSQVQEGGRQVIWPEVLEKLNRMVESLQEEVPKFCEPWDLVEQWKD